MMCTVGGVEVGERRAVMRPVEMASVTRDSRWNGVGREREVVRWV